MSEPGNRDRIPVPVILYHSILRDPARHNAFTVSPSELESDLIWLCEQGYQSVTVTDLLRYVEGSAGLPERPVLLSFDDGHLNNLTYASALLEQYGMRAVMFVVGDHCDRAVAENDPNPNYAYVTWTDLTSMEESGLWEVQSHSYSLHISSDLVSGAGPMKNESSEAYLARLRDDFHRIANAIARETGRMPAALAYPFGTYTAETEQVLRELGYLASFTSRSGISSVERGKPESLYLLCRLLRPSGTPVSELLR